MIVGLVGGWFARGHFESSAIHEKGRSAMGAPATAPLPPVPASAKPATVPPEPSGALRLVQKMIGAAPGEVSELETFTVDQFATYLERHQRSAPSLLAVWNLTKDKSLLGEALEKFPGDIHVVLQAFRHLDLPAEKKLALAAQLEQEHPQSPLGPILAGAHLAKDGRNAEAIGKLREAARREPLEIEIDAQKLAVQEALMSVGKTPLEAKVWGLFNGGDVSPVALSSDLTRPAISEMKSLMAKNDVEAAMDLAGDMLAFAQIISAESRGGMVTDMVTLSIEAGALRHLPPDVEIGNSGQTAADRLAQLKELRGEISQAVDALPWHLSRLDEPGLDLYLQILEHRGQREALKWAENYHGPAPPASASR